MSALVRRLKATVGISGVAETGALPTGDAWDVYIGQVPFMLDPDPDHPFRIKMVGQTLYRYDTSNQAGEQTLGAWWLRSQTSFHGGAGQTYLDGTDPTISSDITSLRFDTCQGVDVWTPGEVSLLNDTSHLVTVTTAGVQLMGAREGFTTELFFYSDGASLYSHDGGVATLVTWGGTGTILSLTQDGTNYYAADATGIYSGPIDLSVDGTLIWDTGDTSVHIAWIKQRLMATIGLSVYELNGSGPTLPTPSFTAPVDWSWNVLADGPSAIYAAGHSGSHSVIYQFVLDDTGGVPTLTTGIAAVTTPNGVIVTALANHSDSWLAVGTDQGLYVAQFGSGGQIGLELLRLDLGGAVVALMTHDRFVYANYYAPDGIGTLARIDLSLQIKQGLFAWAPDLRADLPGVVTQVGLFYDTPIFVVSGQGIYTTVQDAFVPKGTLTTSRVRYDTSEAKIFDAVRWHGDANSGSIECDLAINADNGGRNLGVMTGAGFDSQDVPVLQPGGDWATMTFTLATPDVGFTPTLAGWLMKSLPMQARSYQIMLPLRCYDFEEVGNTKRFGHIGFGLDRVDAIMEMADQETVQILQQTGGRKAQRRSMRVVIDDMDYQAVTPPTKSSATGGLLYLTLRTM